MGSSKATLCFPDHQKSCFACCPPIRQAGYEHIEYKSIIERMLRDNTRLFKKPEKNVIPITGFSCWALGYLDSSYRLIGCMLHPAQNEGIDLRHSTGYGEKCRRETCPEEKTFSLLNDEEQKFWLRLVDDLDSFSYSSKKLNPLFNMLGWGSDLLRIIARKENGKGYTKKTFFRSYRFFTSGLSPRANAYLLKKTITSENAQLLKTETFERDITALSTRIKDWIKSQSIEENGGSYIHHLGFDPLFVDFLRLSIGIRKADISKAITVQKHVDHELCRFIDKVNDYGR